MRITHLQAENIKRLLAVDLTFDSNQGLFVVGGNNDQGKSSVLDSIMYALGGGNSIPDEPIRNGQKKASITVKLDGDEAKGLQPMTVTRRFTDKGSSLEIKVGGKFKASKPQQILDDLFSHFTFDPLAFIQQKPQKQAETLRELVGLDFSELDKRRGNLFANRTDANRSVKDLASRVDATGKFDDVPAEEVSVSGLMDELRKRESHNKDNDLLREKQRHKTEEIICLSMDTESLKVEIEELQERLKTKNQFIQEEEREREKLADIVGSLRDENTDETRQQIESADAVNARVRNNTELALLKKSLSESKAVAEKLTSDIELIDADKDKQLADANWPVDGLGFSSDGVTLNDLPFEQASSAEKLRVSVAMGFAANPTLKLLLIRDGSLLDDSSLAIIAKLAEKHEGQVIMERVGKGQECSVIIEDGQVEAVKPELAAV